MFSVVLVMLFAVVLSSKGGICEVDAHLLCSINVAIPILYSVREAHIGISVMRHRVPDYLMRMS